MSSDNVVLNLFDGEFSVLSKGRTARHAYLNKAEDTGFKQTYIHKDSDDYMPNIHVYANRGIGITGTTIQVCPSKLLYGTNIYETKEEDLERFLKLIVERLEYAGILTDESILRHHYLSGWDVNQLAIIPFTSSVLRMFFMHNIPQPGKSRKGYSIYETSNGWSVHFNFKEKCIKMYDKIAEAMKYGCMPIDLISLFKESGSCLINLEYTMNGKNAIDSELKLIKTSMPNTLEIAFNKDVCSKILQYRTLGIFEKFFTISNDMIKHLASVEEFCDMHKKYNGLQKRNALFGAVCKFITLGYADYCKYLRQHYSPKEVRHNLNILKQLNLSRMPEERLFKETILHSLYSKDYITKDSIIETLNRYKNSNFIPYETTAIQETENLEGADNAK